jgi:hypothetical protein
MVGCALTSKYPSVLVAVAVVATLLRIAGDWRRKVRAVELAALAAMLAAALTMPALVLKNREVLTDLVRQSMVYEGSSMGSYWEQAVRRAEWDQPLDAPEVGLPFLGCVLLGWIVTLADRRFTRTALAWTFFAAALAIVLSRYPFRPFRNLLPLLPLACVLVALLFAQVRERLRWRVWGDAAAVALVLALFLPSDVAYARERAGMVDSRVRALDWVAEHAGPADVVLVSEELAILRGEMARLRAQTEVLDLRQARIRLRRRRDVQLVITGDLGGRGGLGLPDVIAKGKTRAPFELAARFGENPSTRIWRGNRQLVLIFRRGAG